MTTTTTIMPDSTKIILPLRGVDCCVGLDEREDRELPENLQHLSHRISREDWNGFCNQLARSHHTERRAKWIVPLVTVLATIGVLALDSWVPELHAILWMPTVVLLVIGVSAHTIANQYSDAVRGFSVKAVPVAYKMKRVRYRYCLADEYQHWLEVDPDATVPERAYNQPAPPSHYYSMEALLESNISANLSTVIDRSGKDVDPESQQQHQKHFT